MLKDLSESDRERIASLIKELSRTCQQLDDMQGQLTASETEKSELLGKIEKLEAEKVQYRKCVNTMEHEKLNTLKEYEVNVKDLHEKISEEREKKENAKRSLTNCQKELGQLVQWNKKLQSDFIELQQITIKATAKKSPRESEKRETPQILEIPKLESIETALKEIKTQIFECASIYANSRPQSCVTSARSPCFQSQHSSPNVPPSVAKLDLETSQLLDDLNSARDPLDTFRNHRIQKSTDRRTRRKSPERARALKSPGAPTEASFADLDDFEELFFMH